VQRATVAIVLMGTMLAPLGTCLHRTLNPAHSCCAPASTSGNTAQTNCCTARTPLQAIVVAPILPSPAPSAVEPEFFSTDEISLNSAVSVSAVIPPQSPPPGGSILRI